VVASLMGTQVVQQKKLKYALAMLAQKQKWGGGVGIGNNRGSQTRRLIYSSYQQCNIHPIQTKTVKALQRQGGVLGGSSPWVAEDQSTHLFCFPCFVRGQALGPLVVGKERNRHQCLAQQHDDQQRGVEAQQHSGIEAHPDQTRQGRHQRQQPGAAKCINEPAPSPRDRVWPGFPNPHISGHV
jgi:hypothetical protein